MLSPNIENLVSNSASKKCSTKQNGVLSLENRWREEVGTLNLFVPLVLRNKATLLSLDRNNRYAPGRSEEHSNPSTSSMTTSISTTPLSTPSPTPPSTPGPAPSTPSAKKIARGTSFKKEEDELLTKAWVRVSEDAVVGSDQKAEVFYRAVNEFYETIKPAYYQKRNVKSIERRLKKILAECLSFAGCVAKVNNAKPSGCNEDDVVHLGTALFNKIEISSVTEDCGPPFKFMTCWSLLKDHPKFDVLLNPVQPTAVQKESDDVADEDDTNEEDVVEKDEYKRPIGRKRAKAADARAEIDCKKLKVAEASVAAQEKKNKLIEEHHEILLFTAKPDENDPLVREYMNMKRRAVLERMKAAEAEKNSDEMPSPATPSQTQ